MTGPPAATTALPTFSVVIEWDNMRRAQAARTRAMLAALAGQLRDVAPDVGETPLLVIVFDPAEAAERDVIAIVGSALADPSTAEVTYVAAPGLGYYEMKNRGALHCRGDLIVFLDSDVTPQAGWLRRLLASFADPRVAMAAGATAMATDTFLGRAFALFWFFPLPSQGDRLLETTEIFANNMAVRRPLFLAQPFPDQTTYRGQCVTLVRRMRAAGHGVFLVEAARVSHPPPHGAAHFVQRALRHGHDRYRDAVAEGRPPLKTCWRQNLASLGEAWRRFSRHRGKIGLGLAGGIAALAVAGAYYALVMAGGLIGHWRPDLIPRRFAH